MRQPAIEFGESVQHASQLGESRPVVYLRGPAGRQDLLLGWNEEDYMIQDASTVISIYQFVGCLLAYNSTVTVSPEDIHLDYDVNDKSYAKVSESLVPVIILLRMYIRQQSLVGTRDKEFRQCVSYACSFY